MGQAFELDAALESGFPKGAVFDFVFSLLDTHAQRAGAPRLLRVGILSPPLPPNSRSIPSSAMV